MNKTVATLLDCGGVLYFSLVQVDSFSVRGRRLTVEQTEKYFGTDAQRQARKEEKREMRQSRSKESKAKQVQKKQRKKESGKAER